MRPAYLSCLVCPPYGSLCVPPLSKCLFAPSTRGDKEPNQEKGRGKQSGFLCSPSLDMHEDLLGRHSEGTDCNENWRSQVTSGEVQKSSSLLTVPPASFCAFPTCLGYVFRLPEICGAGSTHNYFTSQLLLMRNRRGDATRENVFPFLFVRYVSLCCTTKVAIIEGKSNTEDANFDISKLALIIQNGTILLGGDSPRSLRREMAVSLFSNFVLAPLLFFLSLSSLSLSLALFVPVYFLLASANGRQIERGRG